METSNKIINIKKNTLNQRNLGIEILRMFLCFRIVLLHYYSSNNQFILKIKSNTYQVSTFFFISFYFFYPIIYKRNVGKFILRLERLLVPYALHPIINWNINNIMFLIFKFNRYKRILTLKDLKKQIIVGRGIFGVAVLWFHFNLILFTIFYFICSYLFKDYFLLFFQIISTICYLIQYSEINYYFFIKYTEIIYMSIGNLIETLPISIGAFSLVSINIYQIILKNRTKWLFFSFIFLYLISYYNIFSRIKGFSSCGFKYIFISFFSFTFFVPVLSKIIFGQKRFINWVYYSLYYILSLFFHWIQYFS